MTVSKINPLLQVQYPSFFQSCLNNRAPVVCAASIGIALVGSFFLYRYLNPPKPLVTNLSNYIVVNPLAHKVGSCYRPTQEHMQDLYNKAKAIIISLSEDFRSKVDFNDQSLEIGFKYDMMTLHELRNHDKLWFIFSGEETFKPFSTENIFEWGGYRFCVKNLSQAYNQFFHERADFAKKAENFFQNEALVKTIPDFEEELFSYKSCTDLVSAIFKKSKGLSFADAHSQISPKYFMVSQMRTFVGNNVEVLFMEGLFECQQGDLDAYFDPQTDAEALPLSIRYNCCRINEILKTAGGYTITDIIKAAKLTGIKRVVAIDTQLTTLGDEDHKSRVSGMNFFAKQVIDKEMPKGNYVIFSGAAHAASDDETNIPSFSQLFGIPSIYVHEGWIFMIRNSRGDAIRIPIEGQPNATLHCDFSVAIPSAVCKKR